MECTSNEPLAQAWLASERSRHLLDSSTEATVEVPKKKYRTVRVFEGPHTFGFCHNMTLFVIPEDSDG